MNTIDEKEFLRKNDIIANKRVMNILSCCTVAGPLIAIGTYFKVFEVKYSFCLLVTCTWAIECFIGRILSRDEKHYEATKYFGLISVAVLVGLMGTQFSVGIYLSYLLIPLLSCMYLDSKLTRNISILCYMIMIFALYFRSYGAVIRDFSHFTQKSWFISQFSGYSIEYGISAFALCSLSGYLKGILKKYYEESIEKMNSSQTDRVKSTFIKNMSTELNESLDQVETLTEELMADEGINESICEKVKVIAKTNTLMRSKLKDITDFSRIDLTKKQTTVRKYRMSSLVKEVKQTMQSRIGDKQIDFNIVVNPSIPNELIGDKVRIRQVLINLLSDSIKDEDGFIVLRINWKKKEDMAILYIDVMDNSYDRRVQEAQQANSTFSICKDLCEYMNGKIEISSDYEKGSGFSVTLPQKIVNEYVIYGDVV